MIDEGYRALLLVSLVQHGGGRTLITHCGDGHVPPFDRWRGLLRNYLQR